MHIKPVGSLLEGQRDEALILVERVSNRAESDERHRTDTGKVRSDNRKSGVVLNDRRRGGDDRTSALEEIRRGEYFRAQLIGGIGLRAAIFAPATSDQYASVRQQESSGVIKARSLHAGQGGPGLGRGRPQFGSKDGRGEIGLIRGGAAAGGKDLPVRQDRQIQIGARESHGRRGLPRG